jgi:soluble lytic murein transglycosylase-like protein
MSLKIQKLPWVTEQEANLYSLHICFEADKNKVDPRLIYWLIYEESSFKIGAVSYKNCQSLTQLNPKVFPQYTIKELRDPRVNIPEGIRHFADCKRRAKGNQEFAVRLYHGDPYDPASIRHGRRVMQKYRGEVI